MSKFAQQVGTTRSSRAIRQPLSTDDEVLLELTIDYAVEDHFDAYAVFQYLLSREIASWGAESPRISLYDRMSNYHFKNIGDEDLEQQKKVLRLATIFDVINFGESRSHSILPHDGPERIK